MLIHPCAVTSSTKLTDIQESDIQPNAVDIRLEKVFKIKPHTFILSEWEKCHRGVEEIIPDREWFNLEKGDYEVVMSNIITVGEDEAGWVVTRSTLNRNGLFLTSGLYDSGYNGVMAAVLHVSVGPAMIKKGTRIGQYISFRALALTKYNGSYGLGSEHDKIYGAKNGNIG
jgi:deoxycytidine triphosphate deaminase